MPGFPFYSPYKTMKKARSFKYASLSRNGATMFFGNNRKALLEFLRNLTPQVLFLTLTLIFASKLDLNKYDLSYEGVMRTLPFLSCMLVFGGAFLANMTLFIDSMLTSPPKLKKLTDKITRQKKSFSNRIPMLAAATWRHNKLGYLEVALALAITQTAFIAVIYTAIQSALKDLLP
ncbi:hypothetical protein [Pseudomonas sp. NPDC089734]|uniref:hypothetical protein n=1 Tax=Pseudomonas sp. NPDC089734 TaxID=3364469 RepID=UPI003801266C